MQKISDKVENWNKSYSDLKTTYVEVIETPAHLANRMQWEFVLEDIKSFLPDTEQVKILECGCGGARTSLYLSLRGFDVTCSDYATGALRLAKDNFSANNAKGVFIQDDLLNSKIPNESFDCVMSFGLLEHFEDLQPIIQSITRLVKPGGIQIHNIIPKKFSTEVLRNVFIFPIRFIKNLYLRNMSNIITKSFRDFPHYENTFNHLEYCEAFKLEGNSILRCEAGGILYPFYSLPVMGNVIVRNFPVFLPKLIRMTDRTESKFMHFFSPAFYIVAKKNG